MRVATFNLYQFLEPPFHWYERKDSGKNTYSESQWTAKTAWITTQLAAMNADVVGFQEVFSIGALQQLTAAAGYPHFATVDVPGRDDNDDEVFFNPVVAIASRYEFADVAELTVDDELRAFLPVEDGFDFSRRPLCATVETPEFGEVTVYVAHLKSKRPQMDDITYPDEMPWRDRVLDTMRKLSRGHVGSLLQRGAEAAVVYLRISETLEANEKAPVVVLGDLNDKSDSVVLQSITMSQRIHEVGGVKKADWPPGVAGQFYRFRLADAFHMAPDETGEERPGTHMWDKKWSTLDYVLVSDVFSPRSPNSIGQVTEFEVLNEHVDNDGVGNKTQSDHGQVVVELSKLVPDGPS
ncbi:MAG: endonuclease/exonuclease/phosphatase family protein [Rhodobacter sp.]|nr:endonuclease/exonuclease/phosphatase family protein [Rhodobacter sp.]